MPLHAAKQTGITTIPQEASYHIWQPKKEAETLPQDGGRQERMKVTRAGERLSMDARVHLTPHTHSHKHRKLFPKSKNAHILETQVVLSWIHSNVVISENHRSMAKALCHAVGLWLTAQPTIWTNFHPPTPPHPTSVLFAYKGALSGADLMEHTSLGCVPALPSKPGCEATDCLGLRLIRHQ